MLYRTARFIEAGIKPIYVFDGKAPELKSGELTKRREKREEAQAQLAEAKVIVTALSLRNICVLYEIAQ